MSPESPSAVVQTNVKQGALIGGFVCLALGVALMFVSLLTVFFYGPLFIASFVLAIVAMAQRRTAGGIILLLLTIAVPPVLGLGLGTIRTAQALREIDKKIDTPPAQPSEADLKSASEWASFKIVKARFIMNRTEFSTEPIIEVSVQNDTIHPISRVHFEGTLQTPGRAIPWVKDEFNYEIPGGLEPGEAATWRLAPNRFGAWGEAPDRKDAVLTVVVTGLDGPEDKRLFRR